MSIVLNEIFFTISTVDVVIQKSPFRYSFLTAYSSKIIFTFQHNCSLLFDTYSQKKITFQKLYGTTTMSFSVKDLRKNKIH